MPAVVNWLSHMRRLVGEFATRIYDKFQNIMYWLTSHSDGFASTLMRRCFDIMCLPMKIVCILANSADQLRSQNADAHQRETSGASSDSHQLRPFSNWELLVKERICSQRERVLSFKSSSFWYGKSLLPHKVTSLECYYFYYARV